MLQRKMREAKRAVRTRNLLSGVAIVLAASLAGRAQSGGYVVQSFGPQVLSWQELRAETLRASGGSTEDVPVRAERSSAKLKKESHERVPASPASLPEKTMAEMPSGKVRTISRL